MKKTTPAKKSGSAVQAKRELAHAQAEAGKGLLAEIEQIPDTEIREVLHAALHATRQIVLGRGEDAYVVEEPDWGTRMRAIALLADRKIGLPIRREEHLHRTVTTEEEWEEMLKASPELRSHLRKMIDAAEDTIDV